MLNLGVPHCQALAEAEAECAPLQQKGVVDAVRSEDIDVLLFGCAFLLWNFWESKNKKTDPYLRMLSASDILAKKGLDRDGLILMAILSSGYDTVGVERCGPNPGGTPAQTGVGKGLCRTLDGELLYFRDLLHPLHGHEVNMPHGWPRALPLNHYRNPNVSTPELLRVLQ
ncbi:XPG I-region-domain-containing protein [Macrophomina phaseolina]|uniref:XPG I-region-domain-containing protein n=1 Tax=Macrophomina phaseolina TaxID=35725 RepID=A0ABQ8GKR4_9PEZI|nr:XPG I-region-domain-containing protein [Macrophomina phaseolina]